MSIHVVNKGKEGEREVVRELAGIIEQCIQSEPDWDPETVKALREAPQRNQNQSAVGGGDINLLGISFEVKRQETLSVNAWWAQCVTSAKRNNDLPVLLYRQNRKAWNVVMAADLRYSSTGSIRARVTVDYDTFKSWFYQWVKQKVREGALTRI